MNPLQTIALAEDRYAEYERLARSQHAHHDPAPLPPRRGPLRWVPAALATVVRSVIGIGRAATIGA